MRPDAPAALLLCLLCLLLAQGTHAEERINLEDLELRAQNGNKTAARALAEAYYLGRGGLEQDYSQAARWYRRLASEGDARAQTSLGLMYARGLGFEKNLVEARRWWSLAAAQNDAGAQHNLGVVYREGQGVAPDPAQALQWFRLAAERGHVLSQRMLGLMLYGGEGTSADRAAGLTWITIAAESGEQGARRALEALAERLGPDSLEQARVRAREWRAKNAANR